MKNFVYARADSAEAAIGLATSRSGVRYLGGGTNLVDLMRESIETPDALVDVTGLSRSIEDADDGGLCIGAATTNTALAADRRVRERYPFLCEAILAGASGQIRNLATVAGNLLQRTRCGFFYDGAAQCNKRVPGQGCDAVDGFNRYHAVLGASKSCIAVFPSDMCVALTALDATVHVEGPDGARRIAFGDFHRLPGETPHIENELRPGELITALHLAPCPEAGNSAYRKIRDRASYAFALVSVAGAVSVSDGVIQSVRIGLGGIAHKPWRASRAEAELVGAAPTSANMRRAAEAELAEARGHGGNDFKIELTRRAIVDVLEGLTGRESHQ